MCDHVSCNAFEHENIDNTFESVISFSLYQHVEYIGLLNSVKWLDGHGDLSSVKSQQFEKIVALKKKSCLKLKLKPLPAHLKYAFLSANDTYPVIIYFLFFD